MVIWLVGLSGAGKTTIGRAPGAASKRYPRRMAVGSTFTARQPTLKRMPRGYGVPSITANMACLVAELGDETIDAIYGRCPDASVSTSDGRTYVAFDREASCLETVLESAVADLWQLGVRPLRVEMDVPEPA